MPANLASTLGLLLCLVPALVHAAEFVRPLWARWVVNWVLPFFAPGLPRRPCWALTDDTRFACWNVPASASDPANRLSASADYVFLMLSEQSPGARCLIAWRPVPFRAERAPRAATPCTSSSDPGCLFALCDANPWLLVPWQPTRGRSAEHVGSSTRHVLGPKIIRTSSLERAGLFRGPYRMRSARNAERRAGSPIHRGSTNPARDAHGATPTPPQTARRTNSPRPRHRAEASGSFRRSVCSSADVCHIRCAACVQHSEWSVADFRAWAHVATKRTPALTVSVTAGLRSNLR